MQAYQSNCEANVKDADKWDSKEAVSAALAVEYAKDQLKHNNRTTYFSSGDTIKSFFKKKEKECS